MLTDKFINWQILFVFPYLFFVIFGGKYEKKLLKDLFKDYEALERPVERENDTLFVILGITLQQIIDVDEKNQILISNVWLDLEWKDINLQWNETEYGNVKDIRVAAGKVWRPDILMYNSADERFDGTFQTNAVLKSDGTINYIPPGIFKSTCKIDIKWFPFDLQRCPLKFGSWTYNGFKIDLKLKQNTADISTYLQNGEWDMLGVPATKNIKTYECCPEPYVDITFEVVIRRRTLYYGFNIIIPCVLISSITLLGFALPPDSGEKLTLGVTILLSLTVFLLLVAETMPATSDAVPLIGIYFSCIMVMCSASVLMTVIVLNFHNRNAETFDMPYWIRKIFIDWLGKILRMQRPVDKERAIKKKMSQLNRKLKEMALREKQSRHLFERLIQRQQTRQTLARPGSRDSIEDDWSDLDEELLFTEYLLKMQTFPHKQNCPRSKGNIQTSPPDYQVTLDDQEVKSVLRNEHALYATIKHQDNNEFYDQKTPQIVPNQFNKDNITDGLDEIQTFDQNLEAEWLKKYKETYRMGGNVGAAAHLTFGECNEDDTLMRSLRRNAQSLIKKGSRALNNMVHNENQASNGIQDDNNNNDDAKPDSWGFGKSHKKKDHNYKTAVGPTSRDTKGDYCLVIDKLCREKLEYHPDNNTNYAAYVNLNQNCEGTEFNNTKFNDWNCNVQDGNDKRRANQVAAVYPSITRPMAIIPASSSFQIPMPRILTRYLNGTTSGSVKSSKKTLLSSSTVLTTSAMASVTGSFETKMSDATAPKFVGNDFGSSKESTNNSSTNPSPGSSLDESKTEGHSEYDSGKSKNGEGTVTFSNELEQDGDLEKGNNNIYSARGFESNDLRTNLEACHCESLVRILKEIRFITRKMKKDDRDHEISMDWKFVSMVLDRVCLYLFTIFAIIATLTIIFRGIRFSNTLAGRKIDNIENLTRLEQFLS